MPEDVQKIVVVQQNQSGEEKIRAVRNRGQNIELVQVISIDEPLPTIIDDGTPYLPEKIEADLVLSFVKHPDLALELAQRCSKQKIPIVASGKKIKVEGVHTPPT